MPKKILLADDSLTIQKVVELTFSEEDYDVTVVGDGGQAIERLASDLPDIVLADVMMPKKTGYEVCEFVKGNPATRHIPVLLLVGKFEPFDQDRASRAGADGHILKPFESNVLVRSVTELLASAAAKVPAAAAPAPAEVQAAEPEPETEPAPLFADAAAPAAPPGYPMETEPSFADQFASDPLSSDPWHPPAPARRDSETAQLGRPASLAGASLDTFSPLPPPGAESDDPFGGGSEGGGFASSFAEGAGEPEPFGEPAPAPLAAEPLPLPRVETRAMSPSASGAHETMAAPSASMPGEGVSLDDFPEDIVNAIVERVVKRISDDVVREVAWQVVPELAELLIKKKLEELG